MGEHVGAEQYPTYTSIMFNALKPAGGSCSNRCRDALTRHPAECVHRELYRPDIAHAPAVAHGGVVQNAGFEVRNIEVWRALVTTVHDWIATFERTTSNSSRWSAKRPLGYGASTWVGGALSFEEGRMGVDQLLAVKPATFPDELRMA